MARKKKEVMVPENIYEYTIDYAIECLEDNKDIKCPFGDLHEQAKEELNKLHQNIKDITPKNYRGKIYRVA